VQYVVGDECPADDDRQMMPHTVLSTHRGFIDKATDPVLHSSTYEAGALMRITQPEVASMPVKELVKLGYKTQSLPVLQQLEHLIAKWHAAGDSAIVEAVRYSCLIAIDNTHLSLFGKRLKALPPWASSNCDWCVASVSCCKIPFYGMMHDQQHVHKHMKWSLGRNTAAGQIAGAARRCISRRRKSMRRG
jgi:hypothetical protein